jgi:hypothetical protein
MAETIRTRLERVFETLQKQRITAILDLNGSTGVDDWDRLHYEQIAQATGTRGRWVAATIGHEDERGGYWDQRGRLRYTLDQACVGRLPFRHSTEDCAQALLDALSAERFQSRWPGRRDASAILFLEAELDPMTEGQR